MDRNKLKGLIVMAGLSQRKLAEKMGVSKNTLNMKINGKRPFNTDQIDLICDILNIQSDDEKAQIFLSSSSLKWDNENSFSKNTYPRRVRVIVKKKSRTIRHG